MRSGQVKLGPSFFKKIRGDYSDWVVAMVREACQNGIDAPNSSTITMDVTNDGNDTLFVFGNNGSPMTEHELFNIFLALGESSKDGNNTVGGFGRARELLCFTHLRYEIITGGLKVTGCGGDYEVESVDPIQGTVTRVWIEGDKTYELNNAIKRFIYLTQWYGTFTVNGVTMKGTYRKGTPRRDFDWGTVYTNRGMVNRLVVRIKGVPMFSRYLDCGNKCVLIELRGKSTEILTSNRDALQWRYQAELDRLVDSITVDKKSALRDDDAPVYTRFAGEKLAATRKEKAARQVMLDIVNSIYATAPTVSETEEREAEEGMGYVKPEGVDAPVTVGRGTAVVAGVEVRREAKSSQLRFEFIVKNSTGLETPDWYLPTDFSSYSRKLASAWAKCLVKIHEIFGVSDQFSVGFGISETSEAEYERSPEYGPVYYVNPTVVVRQRASRSRSLSNRWKFTPAGKMAVLACAVHEFTHGQGLCGHDEAYASKLTDNMGVVLSHLKEFHVCFR